VRIHLKTPHSRQRERNRSEHDDGDDAKRYRCRAHARGLKRSTAYKNSGATATHTVIHTSKKGNPKTRGSTRFTKGTAKVSITAGMTAKTTRAKAFIIAQ
jgi:hypothetical protein